MTKAINAGRFWARCDRSGGPEACWPWLGALSRDGYGQLRLGGKTVYAHHVACELVGKTVPDGWVRDHLCRNRSCANPGHIEAVTFAENVRRGVSCCAANARKTSCLQGHEYSEESTIVGPNGRECRVCRKEREQRRPKRDRKAYSRAYRERRKTA